MGADVRRAARPLNQRTEWKGAGVRRFRPLRPLTLSVLVLLGGLTASTPLRDAETLAPVEGVRLVHAPSYLLLGPVSAVYDALTLLTFGQHYAFLAAVIVVFAAWRVLRPRGRGSLARRAAVEVGAAAVGLLALIAVYAAGVLAERPMVRLVVDHPDDVIIDFHSHTSASWDARAAFDIDRNRRWHRDAGFDIGYISDHRTFAAASQAAYTNPVRAGDGTSLLSAVEVTFAGRHVNALGPEHRYAHLIAEGMIRTDAADSAIAVGDPDPVLVFAIPARLDVVRAAELGVRAGVSAIEIVGGAPKGLEQGRRQRELLLRIADSLDLAVVAGSNNHGWGRAAVAWNVMRIPGWRDLHPDSVGALIEHAIRTERRRAVTVIERASPEPDEARTALALTAPTVVWHMLSTLSAVERLAWIAWIWALALLLPPLRAFVEHRARVRFT